jgi:hypothetical protein
MRACVFLTRTPRVPEGETVVVLPPEQADLFEYAGDIWADSVEDALGMLAKGVPGYWLERPIATGDVVYVADLFYVRVGENWNASRPGRLHGRAVREARGGAVAGAFRRTPGQSFIAPGTPRPTSRQRQCS